MTLSSHRPRFANEDDSCGLRHSRLCRSVGFGSGVKASHPADLVSADPFGRSRHAFRAEICAIGKHAGQHGGNVLRYISSSDMSELVGESCPFMHFPQEIGDLDQRIHVRDFGVEDFGRGRYIAGKRRHDQRAVLHPDAIKFPETGAPGQLFEIGVHHLPDLSKPGSAVSLNTEPELILLLEGDKSWLWHKMFVDRPE